MLHSFVSLLALTVATGKEAPPEIVNVRRTYGYLGAPGAGFTPLVTGAAGGSSGSLIGVYAHDGREDLVVTIAMNRNQTHAMVLGHGLVQWLTYGVHLGHWRNWFSAWISRNRRCSEF